MDDLLPALGGAAASIRQRLDYLAANAPQALLFEGGTEEQRLQAGLYWAMTANCPRATAASREGKFATPCLDCVACRQIAANEFLDLRIYDGRISNAQDEENPGPIRSLRMENIRDLKTVLSASPHGDGKRVVLIQGMTSTREEALNSLLKILEEPSRHTLFVLLTSQREQILPTLVSRSLCVTLPWTDCASPPPPSLPLLGAFTEFLATGCGFFELVAAKGAVDAKNASMLLLECQKSLTRAAAGRGNGEALDSRLAKIAASAENTALLSTWIAEAQAMLLATVNPARLLEAFAARLFVLSRQG